MTASLAIAARSLLAMAVFAAVVIAFGRRDDARDPLELGEPEWAPLGAMPPEVAHEEGPFPPLDGFPTLEQARHHQLPAFPAAEPPAASPIPGAAGGPGTGAAGGGVPPPFTPPPPLPGPGQYPFTRWLDDQFVEAMTAAQQDGSDLFDAPLCAPPVEHWERAQALDDMGGAA